jgi:hypothetical protein
LVGEIMAATQSTYLQLRKRAQYLRGESDTDGETITNDHIQAAVRDILNTYPFSWNVATADLTLSSGTASLPADYNPKWGLLDARITGSSTADDDIFSLVSIKDRDAYDSSSYPCWITYNATTNRFIFNTNVQSGTVTIYYHFLPDDLADDATICIIPDWEAVAYLTAAKTWVGDERNLALKQDFEQEAKGRVQSMYQADLAFGPADRELNIVGINPQINGGTYQSDFKIARS